MRHLKVPFPARPACLTAVAATVAGAAFLVGTPVSAAEGMGGRAPAADRTTTVQAVLLTPEQARRATRFAPPLVADPMAGPQGRSCYTTNNALTCDTWFVTERTSSPFPVGVSVTLAASPADAQAALAELAAKVPDPNRPGDRVLARNATLLVTYGTGLAVGPNLQPAVTVTVQRVQGSVITMGTCQVEEQRARLAAMRTCAHRLQAAQADRAARLGKG